MLSFIWWLIRHEGSIIKNTIFDHDNGTVRHILRHLNGTYYYYYYYYEQYNKQYINHRHRVLLASFLYLP